MACKDKCCCPVKRRPAKKRKSTVGKVSATQLLAQSIASLALPRRVNEPFLYGNSPLGEAQRYMKVAEPSKIENVLPKSMSVGSRFEPESVVAKTIQNVNKPLKEGRKTFTPASEVVSKPFNVEQISSTLTPNYLPGAVLPRASIEVPPMSMPLNNKLLNELSTRQRFPTPSTTNTFSGNLPAPVNINLTEAGKGRKIAGLKGFEGEMKLKDFEFTTAGRPKKEDVRRALPY